MVTPTLLPWAGPLVMKAVAAYCSGFGGPGSSPACALTSRVDAKRMVARVSTDRMKASGRVSPRRANSEERLYQVCGWIGEEEWREGRVVPGRASAGRFTDCRGRTGLGGDGASPVSTRACPERCRYFRDPRPVIVL